MVFKTFFDWLLTGVNVIGPTERYGLGRYSEYFLNDELIDMVPGPVLRRMLGDLEERIEKRAERAAVTVRSKQGLIFVGFERGGDLQATAVYLCRVYSK